VLGSGDPAQRPIDQQVAVLDSGSRAPATAEPSPAGGWRRVWAAPLWAHVVALAVVLLALVPVVGTDASFSADEGAAIVQAKSLSAGRGWLVEHPLPQVDPEGRFYPIELSHAGRDGVAPFAKHPLYALVMATADRVGGVAAMVLLSLLGTVVTAALAAALAGELDPTLRRPALWVAGVASPLLFDGFLVMGHALGAACVAGAALLAVVALRRRNVLLAAAVVPCLVVAILLRTEAALLAVALALVMGAIAVRHRRIGAVPLTLIGGAVVAAVGTRLLERTWANHVVGGRLPMANTGPDDPFGFVSGRLHAFAQTWLHPSYDGTPAVELLLVVMAVCIAVGAFIVRRRPQDGDGMALVAIVAGGAAVAALAIDPANLVPGLLIAFPIGLAGLLLIGRSTLNTTTARVLFGTFALFALGVLTTQYSSGGTAEWGGRYFAIGLPLLVPVALLALRDHSLRIGPMAARRALAGLVVCSVALAVMSVGSLRATHRFTGELMSAIERAGRATRIEPPVLVATSGAIPRLAWATFDRQRWLLAPSDDLGVLFDRLGRAGVNQVGFVTHDPNRDLAKLGGGMHVDAEAGEPRGSWHFYLVTVP
jgi:hypothetical protein